MNIFNRLCAVLFAVCFSTSALSANSVGSVDARGTFFKDEIKVLSFVDPQIPTVLCYITYYDRSGLGSDSSVSSLSCVQTGPVQSVPANSANIFNLDKALFKQTSVARFYDAANRTLIYLAYPDSFTKGNAAHEISAVRLQ